MALPPTGLPESSDSDRKRLVQRADSFAIGTGTRDSKDRSDIEEFDEAMESIIHKSDKTKPEMTETEDEGRLLKKHREQHAQKEAERRGSSSPSHQPFLGMSILPGITNPNILVNQSAEGHSQRRTSGVESKLDPVVESISPEILKGLKAAGLSDPIVTLDDPRVSGASDRLQKNFVLSLRSNERVYVWSQNRCHQILSIGLHQSSLESAVGQTIETVRRKGKLDEKTIGTRANPSADFSFTDHE